LAPKISPNVSGITAHIASPIKSWRKKRGYAYSSALAMTFIYDFSLDVDQFLL
jgi:hypothetical protein